jgi:flagellar biosynthesis protein FlhG
MMHTDQAARLREIAFEMKKQNEVHRFPDEIGRAKVIAVASGKGGVGKTNISVNLAISLAKKGKKVVLVDLDLGLANVDILLNVNSHYSLQHLIQGLKKIEDIIVPGPEGIKIVPGGSGLSSLTELTETQRAMFLNSFYTLGKDNDYIIFDTAAGISNNVIKFVLAADEIIVVTTQEPTAITDAYALMKVLSSYRSDLKLNVIINMAKSVIEAKRTFEKLQSVVTRFLNVPIHSLGHVAYDANVPDSIMKRKPFFMQYPFTAATKSIKDIRTALLEKESKSNQAPESFLQRFAQVFSA